MCPARRAAAAADDAGAEAEPAAGVLGVVLGRELLGERPALVVGRQAQVAVGRERHAGSGGGQPLEVRRQARRRNAVDAEGVRAQAAGARGPPSSIVSPERSLPSPSVTSERTTGSAGRLRRREGRRGLANRVVRLGENQVHAGLGEKARLGAVLPRAGRRRRARGPAGSSPRAARASRRRRLPAREPRRPGGRAGPPAP